VESTIPRGVVKLSFHNGTTSNPWNLAVPCLGTCFYYGFQ